jgi:hypothetical protein
MSGGNPVFHFREIQDVRQICWMSAKKLPNFMLRHDLIFFPSEETNITRAGVSVSIFKAQFIIKRILY